MSNVDVVWVRRHRLFPSLMQAWKKNAMVKVRHLTTDVARDLADHRRVDGAAGYRDFSRAMQDVASVMLLDIDD